MEREIAGIAVRDQHDLPHRLRLSSGLVIHSGHTLIQLIRSFTHSFYSSRERFKVKRLILIHNQ